MRNLYQTNPFFMTIIRQVGQSGRHLVARPRPLLFVALGLLLASGSPPAPPESPVTAFVPQVIDAPEPVTPHRPVIELASRQLMPSATAVSRHLEPAATTTHVVRAGESLAHIARRYALTVRDLQTANETLLSEGQLEVGQVLVIPISAAAANPVLVDGTAPPPNYRAPAVIPPLSGPTAQPASSAETTDTATGTEGVEVAAAPTTVAPPPLSSAALTINGIAPASFLILPDDVVAHSRQIYRRGQALGNRSNAFSKIGDCNSQSPYYLTYFDEADDYNLGEFTFLQPVIDHFNGSFAREGVAVWQGNHAWTVITSTWADPSLCEPNETAVACEFRLNQPSVVLIRLGTNEYTWQEGFEDAMRVIIEEAIAAGIIPVLGTKADMLEGPEDLNNEIIRRLAAEYRVPLWDFAKVARTLPNNGLDGDDIHMTILYPVDYTRDNALERGHGVQNITALMMLDAVWRAIIVPEQMN